MKTKKIKVPKIGSWYHENVSNHAYLIIGTKFNNDKELKEITCAFFLDLQYSGTITFTPQEFSKFKKLKINNVVCLEPISKKDYAEASNVLESIKQGIL